MKLWNILTENHVHIDKLKRYIYLKEAYPILWPPVLLYGGIKLYMGRPGAGELGGELVGTR